MLGIDDFKSDYCHATIRFSDDKDRIVYMESLIEKYYAHIEDQCREFINHKMEVSS